MNGPVDVAYLDSPHVAHVDRKAFLLRMTLECWTEDCPRCQGFRCLCACHDEPGTPLPSRAQGDTREAARLRLEIATAEYFARRPA